jgi:CRISPR-associated endonuclease Csn1
MTMRILGLDGGIASIGWAIIDEGQDASRIIACGSRCFDAPETDKERIPTNQIRRQKRGMRRVIRRRAQRMMALRRLLHEHGLLAGVDRNALHLGVNPWQTRAEGLDRSLSAAELSAALGHIARHRGFRSNSKRDSAANAVDETSRMKAALAATQERLGKFRSVGELFAKDPEFAVRKRNRDGDYSRSVTRSDLEHEVRRLFEAQRRLGNSLATVSLEKAFAEIAFFQRPLQDSDHLVGTCPFVSGERRTARRAPSFELFRFLSRLNTIKLTRASGERLTADELLLAEKAFGTTKKFTFKALRKLLKLDAAVRFDGVGADEEDRDLVARSGHAAEGTAALREVLTPQEGSVAVTPAQLDKAAEVITFRNDLTSIRTGLQEAGLTTHAVEALMAALERGKFAAFKGAGHVSAAAARAILPGLREGLMYSEACTTAGFDHAARPTTQLSDIRNPVVRKALGEMLKTVRAIIRQYGLPDLIHVELARDVGKSTEERDEIARGIENVNKQRDRNRTHLTELLKLKRQPLGDEMLRYELWQEQNGRCLYTDEAITPDMLLSTDNRVQVDHILPWSRFGDDSFANKTLCLARANQQKKGRTPFEWFSADRASADWDAFVVRVENCKAMKGRKKRGFYLRKNADEVEEAFRNRNLGDTRYTTRILLDVLKGLYPADGQIHVRARPGALTNKLRRGWGLQGLKKDEQGKRVEDDRHHALDAIVLAATSQSMVQRLTRAFQEAERQGLAREFSGEFVPAPWPGFRLDAEAAWQKVTVSRPERRTIPGEAHAATIKRVKPDAEGNPVVSVRKRVDDLKEADLLRIPVPKPYGRISDPSKLRDLMIASIRDWWAAGKPKDAPPRMPNGDPILKVRVTTTDKPAVPVRGGTAERGDMVRVDVFREQDTKGRTRFHMVPVYPHQLVAMASAPALAVVAARPEDSWTDVDRSGFEFRFSLFINSLVEVTKPDGEVIGGYFKGLNRSTAAITVAATKSPALLTQSIGTKTLHAFRKFDIDRLGNTVELQQEARTWRGVVCTSQNQRD